MGDDDERRRLDVSSLDSGDEAVPPERQPVRHVECGAADHPPVNHTRRDVAVELLAESLAAILEDPLDVHPGAVRDVHGELVASALSGDDGRWEGSAPGTFLGEAKRVINVSRARGFVKGQAEGAENLQEGVGADAHPIPIPVPEAGCDAVGVGEPPQLFDVVRCGSGESHDKAFYVVG